MQSGAPHIHIQCDGCIKMEYLGLHHTENSYYKNNYFGLDLQCSPAMFFNSFNLLRIKLGTLTKPVVKNLGNYPYDLLQNHLHPYYYYYYY